MPVPEYTRDNIVKLAQRVVDSMDLDALVELGYITHVDGYNMNKSSFEEDWADYMEDDDE